MVVAGVKTLILVSTSLLELVLDLSCTLALTAECTNIATLAETKVAYGAKAESAVLLDK
jgi:hypothetical protein